MGALAVATQRRAFHGARALLSANAHAADEGGRAAATGSRIVALRARLAEEDGITLDEFAGTRPRGRIQLGRVDDARLPSHLKAGIPKGANFGRIKRDLRGLGLATVCEEARCPNIGECWGGDGGKENATATIMVRENRAPAALDPHEPENTAEAVSRWGLGYIVLTSVDRDDLSDGGAAHIAATIAKIKQKAPHILVEALVPDFVGNAACVEKVAGSGLEVYAHNVETVERLTPSVRDRRAKYHQSLAMLAHAKASNPQLVTKTSIMLGCGEADEEVLQTLEDLRMAHVDVVTFGQYMRPTKRHMKVADYVDPAKFDMWRERAEALGFLYVASGPLVRSSYKAGEFYIQNVVKKRRAQAAAMLSARHRVEERGTVGGARMEWDA
ncbi:lipoyl synthase [Malassezia sp. CBS 17886]|nr:lipoyl synthase [Malassezia sp. CBS 17886]